MKSPWILLSINVIIGTTNCWGVSPIHFDRIEWHWTNDGPFTNCLYQFYLWFKYIVNFQIINSSRWSRSIVFHNEILHNNHINPDITLKLIRIRIFELNILIIDIYIVNPLSVIFISFHCNLHAILLHYIIILVGVIIVTFIMHRCWTHHGGSNIRGPRIFPHSTR